MSGTGSISRLRLTSAAFLALSVGAAPLLAGCTRTTDLTAGVEVSETTTTLRVPVRRVPSRASTTTTTIVAPEVEGATTVPSSPPAGSKSTPKTTGSNVAKGLSDLAKAIQKAVTTTTVRPNTTTTRPPAPTTTGPTTTTTTMIPSNPGAVVVTARNALVHQGESQTISVRRDADEDEDDEAVELVACGGRDYRLTTDGFVSAGFVTPTTCSGGNSPSLVRTLPANVPYGQFVFCTEIDPAAPTTVCTYYVVTPYPT